jgi:hypothetical protein
MHPYSTLKHRSENIIIKFRSSASVHVTDNKQHQNKLDFGVYTRVHTYSVLS